jgi:pimeloyl-ACP methyl ester carboxylesterase
LSDKPKDVKSYHVSGLVQDILSLITALEYEKVNLVEHDWGAGVAWTLANKYPERLHRLGIMNVPQPAVMPRFRLRDFEQIRRSWYVFLFQLPWLPEAGLQRDDWRGLIGSLRNASKPNSLPMKIF